MDISGWKDITEIIESVATAGAFIAAGCWAYLLFIKNRRKYPRAKISHTIHHRKYSETLILIHVEIKMENVGEVLLSLDRIMTWVCQIQPLPSCVANKIDTEEVLVPEGETEIDWPHAPGTNTLEKEWGEGDTEIEPGEAEIFHFDFIVTQPITTVSVYSYIRNKSKKQPTLNEFMTHINDYGRQPEPREIGWDQTTLYDL